MNRQSKPEQRAALKLAFHRLVIACGGTIAAAKLTRVAASHISDYCNPAKDTQAPLDVVLDLALCSGDRTVIETLAELIEKSVAADDPTRTAGELSEAAGKLAHLTIEANADQHYSVNESRPILAVAAQAKDLIGKLEHPALKAIAGVD